MNKRLISYIKTIKDADYLVLKLKSKWSNSLRYMPNLFWGLIIGGLFSVVTDYSLLSVSLLVIAFYFLTTGLKIVVNLKSLNKKRVDLYDFRYFPLTDNEKVIVENAQRRQITYRVLLKEMNE